MLLLEDFCSGPGCVRIGYSTDLYKIIVTIPRGRGGGVREDKYLKLVRLNAGLTPHLSFTRIAVLIVNILFFGYNNPNSCVVM